MKISLLKEENIEENQQSMASDINALPNSISAVSAKESRIREVLSPDFWKSITAESIDALMDEFCPLMKYRKPIKDIIISMDEGDDVIERRWIDYSE